MAGSRNEAHVYRSRTIRAYFNKPIVLSIFGDVHKFAETHAEERWKEYLREEKALAKQGNRYWLGVGDYIDSFRSSTDSILRTLRVTRSDMDKPLEWWGTKTADAFLKDISFMDDHLLAMVDGNHTQTLATGMTTTEYICERIKCLYGSSVLSLRLRLECFHTKKQKGKGTFIPVNIFAFHGRSVPRLIGSKLHELEQKQSFIAQVYVAGHAHQLVMGKTERIQHKINKATGKSYPQEQEVLLVRCGSFLKSAVDGVPNYAAKFYYPPTALGMPEITLTPKRVKKDGTAHNYVKIKGTI